MARMSKRPHRSAVTRMLRATGLVNVPEEAPLVELVRSLADEMDAGGGARTRADYLSALKDVRRVLNASEGRPRGSAETRTAAAVKAAADVPAVPDEPTPNDLAKFKERKGIA